MPIDPLKRPDARGHRGAGGRHWPQAVLRPLARARATLAAVIGGDRLRAFRNTMGRLVVAGTAGYPEDVRRRLKILNLIAYLIAALTFVHGSIQALSDPVAYAPAIALNALLVVAALLVPFAHRISDTAGGLLLVGTEYAALMGFTAFLGRDGGAQLHYFIAAAAPFVVFGLGRLRLVMTVVTLGLVLHLYGWFTFPKGLAAHPPEASAVDGGYTAAAITTFVLIAASIHYAFRLAEQAKAETDALLRNILPDSIVERLKANPGEPIADSHASASVLFADISGFVALAQRLGAREVVALLNRIVTEFDALAARHGVEKIKTIGDAYMAVAGLPEPQPDHTRRLAALAFDMQAAIGRLNADTGHDLRIRIGIASGPVMAGVIGADKFSYDVWGDAVNLASRLEQRAEPGRILICPACRATLEGHFGFESRGTIDIKGLGACETWHLVSG